MYLVTISLVYQHVQTFTDHSWSDGVSEVHTFESKSKHLPNVEHKEHFENAQNAW